MKRLLPFLICITTLCCTPAFLFAQNSGNIDIVFSDDLGDTIQPRGQSTIPVQGEYIGMLSSIEFSCTPGLGTLNIIITNAVSGEYISTVMDTNNNPLEIIPINGSEGIYIIHIILSDGTTYYGELEI